MKVIGLIVLFFLVFFGIKSFQGDSKLAEVIGDTKDGLLEKAGEASDSVATISSSVSKNTKDLAQGALDKTKDLAQGALDNSKDLAKGALDNTKGALSKLGSLFDVKLPDGTSLNIPKNGVENKLLSAMKGDNSDSWLNLDRINFKTGSANLSDESEEQIKNIASILKAYPNLKLKIGGYTDSTGSDTVNKSVSAKRAKAVSLSLKNHGIDGSRLQAEGYGELHPVASNDTPEGRAQNRRIALKIVNL